MTKNTRVNFSSLTDTRKFNMSVTADRIGVGVVYHVRELGVQ